MSEQIGPNPCGQCGGEYGEHKPSCPRHESQLTLADRLDRAERAIAEIQRHLRESNGFAPSPDLDLIDLR